MKMKSDGRKEPNNFIFLAGAIAFFLNLSILGMYLYFFRAGKYSEELVFWICSFIALTLIIIGSLWFSRKLQVYIILFAIILFIWLIKSVYVPTDVPFFGSDAYVTLSSTESISKTGWFKNPPWDKDLDILSAQGQAYPFLSGIAISFSALTGVSLEMIARWVSIILSLISIGLVFGITYQIFRSEKTALLSALGFGTIYYFLMFHTLFVREALAFTFFLATIYAFIEQEKTPGAIPLIIPFLLVIGLVLSHHLTALMLVLFVFTSLILKLLLPRKIKLASQEKRSIEWPFLGYLVVAMLTYWVYLRYTPIQIINGIINNAFSDSPTISLSSAIPNTSRYIVTLVLQMFSALLLGLLALIGLIKFQIKNYFWQIMFVLWGGSLGLIVLVGGTGALGALGVFPSRMEIYGYTFLIPAACHTIVSIYRKLPWGGIVTAVVTLLLCSSSSLLRTAPYLYSNIQPNYAGGEKRAILSNQDYRLVSKMDPNKKGLIGSEFRGPVKLFGIQASFPEYSDLSNLDEYDYLVITPVDIRMHQIVATMPNYPVLNKVYDLGSAELYIPVSRVFSGIGSTLRYPEIIVSQIISGGNWLAIILILLFCFITGFILVDLLGFGLSHGQGYSPLSKQALGFCVGLFLLFTGFLIYDIMDHWSAILIIIPLAISLLAGAIALLIKPGSIRRLSRFTSSWFFIAIIFIVGLGSYSFEIASEKTIKDPYTEFYINTVSQNRLSGTVVVINQGTESLSYDFKGWAVGHKFIDTQFTLQPHQSRIEPFLIDPAYVNSSSNLPIKFTIMNDLDGTEQYLYLWPQ